MTLEIGDTAYVLGNIEALFMILIPVLIALVGVVALSKPKR